MRRISIIAILIVFFHLQVINSFSQSIDIQPPLNIPLYLSGNYGELRSTHFHAGIDIKTESVVGKPVFSVQDGYVSRMKVQSGGYGHAVYITHSNGYTSVYGHLQEFYHELESYLIKEQYKRKSFEVDIYLEKDQFRVAAGQKIAKSGNTGRSGGPHLHFEIRNSNQVPLNALKFNLPVKDTIAPKFIKLAVYNNIDSLSFKSSDKRLYSISGRNGKYKVTSPIAVSNKVAFGAEVYDFLNGSNNKCGVYELDFYFDEKLIYSFTVDGISFSKTRYIKSHLDYAEKKLNRRNIHKLFHEPNNKLLIYNEILNKGIISIHDTLPHKAYMLATDVYGNESRLDFSFYLNRKLKKALKDTGSIYMPYNERTFIKNESFSLNIPAYSLYSNKWLSYFILPSDENFYSAYHLIGDELVAVNKYPVLKLKVTKPLNKTLPEKLVVASVNDKGELSSEGGAYSDGIVSAKISGFGRYVVVADTLPPKIKSLSFRNGAWYASNDRISFKITDDLSGVKTYNGYIDGEWALFEYDVKSNLLFYNIDSNRLERTKSKHKLALFVLDERNNLQKFEGEFYY